ncbi:MAG: hypothetical protein QM762_09475 [Chryseolinea sp.]
MARNYYFRRQTAIEVIYSSPRDTAFTPSPLNFVNEKFMKISLDGSRDDEIKLAFARIAIREMIHHNDTTQGIEFNLKPTLKYRTLIELYNICNEEDVRTYIHYGNKFWVFNLTPFTLEDDRRHEPSLMI